jgi:alpha-glucosidase
MWWRDAVIYQVYPRSFQDSDGDGIGDLRGIQARLDYLVELGVDALWLSPIYPSPLADFGYDVSDYEAVDPVFGTLGDFDQLVAAVHERGLKLLMDLVPCHTSIEHRWFREHPDWYVWSDGEPERPPNNWLAAFGGPAWSWHEPRRQWYLHSFYPEQPDLDWRNPEVPAAFARVIRFWLERGVDGFRLDALDRLMKDGELRDEPRAERPFALPLPEEQSALQMVRSRNDPEIGRALAELRRAAGDSLLVGEVYLPAAEHAPYLEHVDATFAFEFFHSPWVAEALKSAITGAVDTEWPAWVLSNHDFPRLATRFGAENAAAAAVLLLTLPGLAFVYAGEEIGMVDGPGAAPPFDRAGRDPHRHPMQWAPDPAGGFTTGEPWLTSVDPERRNVRDQREDPTSLLSLYRRLIAFRRTLPPEFELLDSPPGVLAYRRGRHEIALKTAGEPRWSIHPGMD